MSEYSSNHYQITGDFGEHLVLYLLSKNGYECAHVQHVGIDIIASKGNRRIGISVKSRSRKTGKKPDNAITIQNIAGHIQKMKGTCKAFGCEEYFAFVIDQKGSIKVVITPLKVVIEKYKISNTSSQNVNIEKLAKDRRSKIFQLNWQ